MKRFFGRIGGFFWSWGFLKFVLWTVTLVVLFYVEEDGRGARDWAHTKAKWEARGETFEASRLIPPPIPASENLAAIPLFDLSLDHDNDGKGYLAPRRLLDALNRYPADRQLPRLGDWQGGEIPDMQKAREEIALAYTEIFKAAPPSKDPLVQLEAIYPFIAELQRVSALRSDCDFRRSFSYDPPDVDLFVSLMTAQVQLARVLTVHAVLALDERKPEVALQDTEIMLKLDAGLRRQSNFVAGLCSVALNAILQTAVYDGLFLHAWSDAQLGELDHDLGPVDFLSDYQRVLRGNCVVFLLPAYDYLKQNRSRLKKDLQEIHQFGPKIPEYFPYLWPDGWLDQNKSGVVDYTFRSARAVDPAAHRVYPGTAEGFAPDLQHGLAPWNILSRVNLSNFHGACSKFAVAQVWVDQARIACALERYRLVHHVYPTALGALVPAFAGELPLDVFSGRPYCYRLRPDGSYLLYSVGWNQIDDGGRIIPRKDNPHALDSEEGDWVWPVPGGSRPTR